MNDKCGRIIVISAPSGCGKSTIINALENNRDIQFCFSVSATNRPPRQGEIHGKDYYFLDDKTFRKHIIDGDFVEYCEVYPGRYYGTLKSEISEKCKKGSNVLLDIDVEGALNIKRVYNDQVLTIFIMPPSLEALRERLTLRGTDDPDKIEQRLSRASYEIEQSSKYDCIVINDSLEIAVKEIETLLKTFLES